MTGRNMGNMLDTIDGPIGVYAQFPGDKAALSLGGVDALRSIAARDIERILKLTPMQEFHRFGHAHTSGAVVLLWQVTSAIRAP